MEIVYHLGAHCTDEERLLRCLLKNRGQGCKSVADGLGRCPLGKAGVPPLGDLGGSELGQAVPP